MEIYMAVLGAWVVLISPLFFYLWLRRFVQKEFGSRSTQQPDRRLA